MDGVMDIASARALVGNAVLWPKVRDFLWDFAPMVDNSWLDGVQCGALCKSLADSPRAKQFVLDALGIVPCFHDFPEGDGSRLLLLDSSTIQSLVAWLGTAASSESLRKITDGTVVRAFKSAFPGIYPDVFSYTAYFRNSTLSGGESAASPEDVFKLGFGILFSLVEKAPPPLVRRLVLKLPRRFEALCAPAAPAKTELKDAIHLLKLRFPEAHVLCCS